LDDLGSPPNDTSTINEKVRLSGNFQPEFIFEAEIKSQSHNLSYLEKFLKESNLDRKKIRKLTDLAIKYQNKPALHTLARINRFVVAEALQHHDAIKLFDRQFTNEQSNAPEIFFIIRNYLNPTYKKIYRRLARSSILHLSLKIASKWIKGSTFKKVPYSPGLDFDLDDTLDSYFQNALHISYDNIVALSYEKKLSYGIVIIDTSGSMHYDKIINAALTASVLAYSMRYDHYSIITFNTQATILTKFSDLKNTEDIVDQILESEPIGYTNISSALKLGLDELAKIKHRDKWAILITDGLYNRGGDPRPYASQYPKLHIISIPSQKYKWGIRVCSDLAKKGRGRFIKVYRYSQIPYALSTLLRDI